MYVTRDYAQRYVTMMKQVCLLAVIALFGCTSQPTTEELESEALETGDWSEVEQRARVIERMSAESKPKCPEHLMLVCIKDGEHEECFCASRD